MPSASAAKRPAKFTQVRNIARTPQGLMMAVPVICKGEKCEYVEFCHVHTPDWPLGKPCPIEQKLAHDLAQSYVSYLDVDPQNPVDMELIAQAVDLSIQIQRCRKLLASQKLVQEVPVAVDNKGRPLYKPEVNKLTELLDMLLKRHHMILDWLFATRKNKWQAGNAQPLDPSSFVADLVKKARDKKAVASAPSSA